MIIGALEAWRQSCHLAQVLSHGRSSCAGKAAPTADAETEAAAAEPSGEQLPGAEGGKERIGVGAAPADRGAQGAGQGSA